MAPRALLLFALDWESRVIKMVDTRAMQHPSHMLLVGFSPAAVARSGVKIAVICKGRII